MTNKDTYTVHDIYDIYDIQVRGSNEDPLVMNITVKPKLEYIDLKLVIDKDGVDLLSVTQEYYDPIGLFEEKVKDDK